jgi:hypothetical protein
VLLFYVVVTPCVVPCHVSRGGSSWVIGVVSCGGAVAIDDQPSDSDHGSLDYSPMIAIRRTGMRPTKPIFPTTCLPSKFSFL